MIAGPQAGRERETLPAGGGREANASYVPSAAGTGGATPDLWISSAVTNSPPGALGCDGQQAHKRSYVVRPAEACGTP
eukprot:1175989-Prorocentrum_minimum.AAC.2